MLTSSAGFSHALQPASQPASQRCGANVEALVSGLLTDCFDAVALNYAACDDDGAIVGSMRVVPDGPIGLPLEECWPLDGFRSGKRVAELCRLAVTPKRRLTRLPLLLMKAGWQGARRLGVSHVLVDAYVDNEQRTHAVYKKLGFSPLGGTYVDSRYRRSDPSVVMAIECDAGEEALPPHLRNYFRSADPLIDHGD